MEEQETLGPDDYARWALLGDPHTRVPTTLKELVDRVGLAIRQYAGNERKKQTTKFLLKNADEEVAKMFFQDLIERVVLDVPEDCSVLLIIADENRIRGIFGNKWLKEAIPQNLRNTADAIEKGEWM